MRWKRAAMNSSEAENGEQALRQVGRRHPDVILLDVMMPQMDGFEVCRRLKKDPGTAAHSQS